MKHYQNLEGMIFNDWVVTNESIIDIKLKKRKWKCVCKCGLSKFVYTQDLISNKSRSCHSCGVIRANLIKNKIPLTNTMWGKYINSAKVRSLEFSITKEQAYDKFLQQGSKCVYTGLVLTFNSSSVKTDGTASLDRIDSSKGYIINNIQWVHKKVNCIKMNFSHEDFIKICHLVSKNTDEPNNLNLDICFKPKSNKYYNKRDNCLCGNLKLKTSNKCKECYNIHL